ncbi:hypothetical protein FYJ75_00305 [Roseburia sp. MUC/MUC-530-WT-4D]|uniref:Uncharacterized protein n=1 Tax=Roseburia porci TaxID=2605790 RepID=A0A6L5YLV1_9FIRM|nr:hypothetical protein [Roseburia porci]MST73473.1 hypothetical protein [Roseburia porci]
MSLKEVLKQLGIKLIGWVKSNCVNNLLSDRADLPLAAAQGKVIDEKITALNSNIATKADIQKQGYDKTSIIYLQKNRSALVIFGKQTYSQTSLLFYDTKTKAVQALVNPSSDTFTVDILDNGTVRITSKNATYSTKAAIYLD